VGLDLPGNGSSETVYDEGDRNMMTTTTMTYSGLTPFSQPFVESF